MSETTHTRGRNKQHETNPPETAASQTSPPNTESNTVTTETPTAAPTGTVEIEIAGLQVTLPVKFVAGMVLTDNQAKVLDAAYQRQFTNNQNALAKARADKLAKATTDEDKAKHAALSATALAALYTDYEPSVGGRNGLETLRKEAAWKALLKMVAEHNEAVRTGGAPVMVKAGKSIVTIAKGTKDASVQNMLAKPEYAERVQIELDALLAEREANKGETAKEGEKTVSAADLF